MKKIFFFTIFISTAVFGAGTDLDFRATKGVLGKLYVVLEDIKSKCGRYPTTSEGWPSIWKRPKGMNCPANSGYNWDYSSLEPTQYGQKLLDYSSDGEHFRIDGPGGFYVTESSTRKGRAGFRWDNPNVSEFYVPDWVYFYSGLALFFVGCGLLWVGISANRRSDRELKSKRNRIFRWSGFAIIIITILAAYASIPNF